MGLSLGDYHVFSGGPEVVTWEEGEAEKRHEKNLTRVAGFEDPREK